MSLGNINSSHRNERIITFVCVQHTTDVETHAGSISWAYFRGLEWSWCRFLKWIGSQNLKFMIHCKNLQRLCWLQMVIVVELFRSVPVLCFGCFGCFGLDLVINSSRLDVFDVQALVLLFRSLRLVQRFFFFLWPLVQMVNRYSMLFPGVWATQFVNCKQDGLKVTDFGISWHAWLDMID